MKGARSTDQLGSVSVVVAALAFVMLVCTMGIADVGSVLATRAHTRAAADAAALAAAQELAFPSGSEPAEQAALLAERNGAELIACTCAVGSFEAVVTVRATGADLLLMPGSITLDVQARAVVDLP
jgi:secretion/DNA translocation related TadE-like protein